ncbi:hypothetical protein DAI22_07g228950 [Oryza sativa Japonica Group]|nr:hypothetical protein DAI22_07g228950 [Oryza sativa Japonica Group]
MFPYLQTAFGSSQAVFLQYLACGKKFPFAPQSGFLARCTLVHKYPLWYARLEANGAMPPSCLNRETFASGRQGRRWPICVAAPF